MWRHQLEPVAAFTVWAEFGQGSVVGAGRAGVLGAQEQVYYDVVGFPLLPDILGRGGRAKSGWGGFGD